MRLYLIFIAIMVSKQVAGQTFVWNPGEHLAAIGMYTSFLEDKEGKLKINDVRDSKYGNLFHTSNSAILHFGFTNSIFWIRFELRNDSSDSLYLRLDQAFLQKVELYYMRNDSSWRKISSGYGIGLGNKQIVDHSQIFALPSGDHKYFLRLQPYIHAIPIQLIEKKFWYIESARQKMSYGIYAGILLFAVIIDIFLFISLRKTYFLNYAVLVFFYLLTSALVMEGYAVYFFPTIDLMFWYKVVPVLDMPAFLFYCISFFELKKIHPHLYLIALYGSLFFCVYLFLLPLLPLLTVLLLNQVFALMVFVFGIHTGRTVGKAGNKLGYLFAAAYFLWFFLILIEVIYIQTGFPQHFSSLSYVSTAIFIEAFLLAFLQAKRFQWEKEEDQLKQFKMKQRIENMEQDFQREVLNTKLEIQEQTFNSISEEIHDNVGQLLSVAKIQVSIIEQKEVKDEETLKELKENVGQAMTDLRLIAKNLSSFHIQNTDLADTIANQIQQINRLGLVKIKMSLSGTEHKLDHHKKLVLYRVVQEGLQNIVKHSKALNADVLVNYMDTHIQIIITDNGIGFDQIFLMKKNHGLGLQNLKARAELIGGESTVTSILNQGTTIKITTPYV